MRLKVWPFAVPSERHLHFANWFEPMDVWERYKLKPWSEEYWAMLDKYVANAAAHRQDVTRTLLDPMVKCWREPNGKLTFDFSLFDRWVEVRGRTAWRKGLRSSVPAAWRRPAASIQGGLASFPVAERKTGKLSIHQATGCSPGFCRRCRII